MARGGAKTISSYTIACQDCATSWSSPDGDGWTSAYSSAERHARQQTHHLEVYQGRTWLMGHAPYDGKGRREGSG